jgi:hypothetical protein
VSFLRGSIGSLFGRRAIRWPLCVAAVLAAILAVRLPGQAVPPIAVPAPVPFGVGEQLIYEAEFNFAKVPLLRGTGQMEIVGIEEIRGRPAYHIVFTVRGGLLGLKVDDRYDSWIDTATLSSLRHVQRIHEVSYHRETTYEIYPDRGVYTENGGAERESVANPLDDGSFMYFVRTVTMHVGEREEFRRYFKPDQNPVVLEGLQTETVHVPAGTFDAIEVHPTIKSGGIFADKGDARIWFSQDSKRIMLQMKAKMAIGSLSLYLKSYRPATAVPGTQH